MVLVEVKVAFELAMNRIILKQILRVLRLHVGVVDSIHLHHSSVIFQGSPQE